MSAAYVFRLASVLRLRRAEFEQSELALVDANARLRMLIARRDEETRRCVALSEAPAVQSVEHFTRQRAAASLAASGLIRLDAAINVAAAEAALARLAWAAANRRVATLERLDATRREEWLIEESRRETRELDELATAAFVREQLEFGAAR